MFEKFADAKHIIDRYLITAMSMNTQIMSFSISSSGEGKKCVLKGEILNQIKNHYKNLYFEWSEIDSVVTLTWK